MRDFLGRGIGFPLEVDSFGSLRMAEYEQSVAESVRMILGSAPGERMMRPKFGCRIHDLVFHPADANTCALASNYVTSALIKWEPRIEDIEVDASPDPERENVILLAVRYKVRRTNNLYNMVYPFYLRREQDL